MKKNANKFLVLFLCIILQLNSMHTIFAIEGLAGYLAPNNTSKNQDQIKSIPSKVSETCTCSTSLGGLTLADKPDLLDSTDINNITPLSNSEPNATTVYGEHTSSGHKVYSRTINGLRTYKGYYVKLQSCSQCYNLPSVAITNISSNTTLTEKDTNFIPTLTVSQVNNYDLQCEYYVTEVKNSTDLEIPTQPTNPGDFQTNGYINNTYDLSNSTFSISSDEISNSKFSDTITVSDTRISKTVSFLKGIDTSKLKEGKCKLVIGIKILDGCNSVGYATVTSTYFMVDKSSPVISASTNSYTDSATVDLLISDISTPVTYRYTFEDKTSEWTSANKRTYTDLTPNSSYSCKVEAKDSVGHIASRYVSMLTKAEIPVLKSISSNNATKLNITFDDKNPIDKTLYGFKVESSDNSGTKTSTKYVSNAEGYVSSDSIQYFNLNTNKGKSLTISELNGNTNYTVTVYVKDQSGATYTSNPMTIKTEPTAPTNLRIVENTNTSITLKWDASSGANYYDIYRIAGSDANGDNALTNTVQTTNDAIDNTEQVEYPVNKLIKDIATTIYKDEGLSPNTLYTYKICAKSCTGEIERTWSEYICVRTLLDKPYMVTGLSVAYINDDTIGVSWTSQDNIIGYKVRTDNAPANDYYTTQNYYEFTPTQPNKQYSFTVTAFNVKDENEPNNTSLWKNESNECYPVTIQSHANIPGIINITENKYNSVKFEWDKNSNPDTVRYKYTIYAKNTTDNTLQEVATSSLTYNNYGSFSNLNSNTPYVIKVIALNSNDVETQAKTIDFTTKIAPPDVIENVQFISQSNQIIVQWDACTRAASYTVKRDNAIIAHNITATSYIDTNVTPNTVYNYEIIAENESGTSSVTKDTRTKYEKPIQPILTLVERDITHITISWNTVDNATGYEIKYGDVVFDAGESTQFENIGLISETSYTYRVRAKNIDELGDWSEPLTIKTKPSLPMVPGGIEVTSTDTSISIAWQKVDNADTYVVNIDEEDKVTTNLNNCTYTFDETVQPESTHTIKIKAINESGNSEYSTIQNVVLQPKLIDAPQISATIENSMINLTWNSVESAIQYEINIDNSITITQEAPSVSYIDTESSLSQNHTYTIRAIFEDKEGDWSYPITVKALPEKTIQLIAIPTYDSITVQWSESTGADTYELYANGELIYTGSHTYFQHIELTENTSYTYTVKAKNESGYGLSSDEITIKTLKENSTVPQNIRHRLDNTTAIVTWDAVENAQGYMIQINNDEPIYTTDSSMSFATTTEAVCTVKIATVIDKENNLIGEWSPEITFFGPVSLPTTPANILCTNENNVVQLRWTEVSNATEYDVEIDGNNIVRISTTTFTDDNVPYQTSRTYRLRSHNSSGVSEWSEAISITTGEALPGTPLNIICKNSASTKNITIDWDDVEGTTSYEIHVVNGNTYTSTTSNILIDDLLSGTPYQVKIRAITTEGEGPWSNPVNFTTNLLSPTNLCSTATEDGQVQLNWDTTNGATSYDIEVDDIIIAHTENNSIAIPQLCKHINHSIRVRGVNSYAKGEWSDLVVFDDNKAEEVTVTKDEKLSLLLPVSNVTDIGTYKMTIVINTDELALLDACGLTYLTDTKTTYIVNHDMQIILEQKDNLCYISIYIDNNSSKAMSGIINSIKLFAKVDCTTSINYYVTKLQ